MQSLLEQRVRRGARLLAEAARQPRRAQQLPGSVDVEGEPDDLVQSGEGPHAAARDAVSSRSSNPLGAADLLLHGENNLHGWGQFAFPDPTLLYVRGFDPHDAALQVRGEPALRRRRCPQFNAFRAPVTLTCNDARRRRPDARAAGAHAAARSRPHAREGQQGARADAQGDVRHAGGVLNPMASDPAAGGHARADRRAGGQHRDAQPRVHVRSTPSGRPSRSISRRCPTSTIRARRIDRYQTAREGSVDMLIRLAPDIKRTAHARAAAQAARVRRQLSRHALSRVDPLRHGRCRWGPMMMSPAACSSVPGAAGMRTAAVVAAEMSSSSGIDFEQRNSTGTPMKKTTLQSRLRSRSPRSPPGCLAQSLPPVRQLGPVTAVAKEPLGAVSSVRHLPDGRVIVNDIVGAEGRDVRFGARDGDG